MEMSTYQDKTTWPEAALVPAPHIQILVLRTALDNQGLWELKETALT
jgi:hypothetical protein